MTMIRSLPVLFCTILTALIGPGCVRDSVPVYKLTVDLRKGQAAITNPKDTTITNLKVSSDTNGAVSVSADSISSKMNPDVITTTGDAQVKMINAIGDNVTKGIAAGAAAAGSGGTSAILPAAVSAATAATSAAAKAATAAGSAK